MKPQSLTPAVFVIILAMGELPAAAQSTNTNSAAPVEVTPYASLGSYPSPRVGAAVAFRLTPTLSVESEVGYRRDITGRLSATASFLYDLPRIGRLMPYLAAGAGLEEYATALKLPDGTLAAQPRTAFAINAGGGLKVPVDDNWGIRTDARWFNGLGRDAGEHWRLYNGVTFPPARADDHRVETRATAAPLMIRVENPSRVGACEAQLNPHAPGQTVGRPRRPHWLTSISPLPTALF